MFLCFRTARSGQTEDILEDIQEEPFAPRGTVWSGSTLFAIPFACFGCLTLCFKFKIITAVFRVSSPFFTVKLTFLFQPKYTCICDAGWTNSGSDPACTTDVNECTGNQPPCSISPPVQCINLPGSFTCGPCPPGYSGNGFSCVDINECAVNNGGCSLAPRVECVNTPGSRTCGPCPSGIWPLIWELSPFRL